MTWPGRLAEKIKGRNVIEIGPDLGLSAFGYQCVGAASYFGAVCGNLSRSMMRTEQTLDHATYLPVESVGVKKPVEAELCLVHAAVADQPDVQEALARIRENSGRKLEILMLPERGEAARRMPLG